MFAAFGLLFACTPEENRNNGGGKNNSEELTTTGEALEVTDNSAKLTGYANLPLELGDAEVGIMYDKVQSFESSKKAVATGLDGNNKFTVIVIGLEPSTTYYYKSYVQNGMAVKYGSVLSFTTKESIVPAGAVDLGIIMTREDGTTYNLYWAKSNLSVNGLCPNPEEYGDYYAWGELEPHYAEGHSQDSPCSDWRTIEGKTMTGYNWASYKWCNGDYNKLTRYCPENKTDYWDGTGSPDNKTTFSDYNYADDAARAKLGGKWRMPTDEEWTELRTNCTWTWTTNYNGTGVAGRIVTSNVEGYKDKSIFLPAAGCRDGTGLYGAGSGGGYWSSSLDTGGPGYAWCVYFASDDVFMDGDDRFVGRSVRPVSE